MGSKVTQFVIPVLFSLLTLLLLTIAISTPYVGGDGDTISHYMFSRYSWQHPDYFIDHWAKPVFTFLSSPFAQFGFEGIMIFNVLCGCASAWITYLIARKLSIRHSWIVAFMVFAAPLFTVKMYSGFTEYLYALFLVSAIWLILKKQYLWAGILISFFPFCRSEGLIGLIIFGSYFIWTGKYKYVPFFLTGTLLYELIGVGGFNQDWGWTWNKIPYVTGTSDYGSGGLLDFIDRLRYVIELPMIILVGISVLLRAGYYFKREHWSNKTEADDHQWIITILIFGNFVAFWVAHSLFWYFGLFNSYGLARVLIAVTPLAIIVALEGTKIFDYILLGNKVRLYLQYFLLIVILAYPFIPKDRGAVFKKTINALPENDHIRNEIGPWIQQNYPNSKKYYNAAYFAIFFEENLLAKGFSSRWFLKEDLKKLKPGDLYIWDHKFSVIDRRISYDEISRDLGFTELRCFEADSWRGHHKYCIFQKVDK